MPDNNPTLRLENVRLLFRNFAGIARPPFNTEGDRNFNVIIEPELAKKLIEEKWRIKQLTPREEGEEGDYILKVNVNYGKGRPPRCVLVSSRGRQELGADEVGVLDFLAYEKVDLFVNGWWSDMAGGGYGGYLKYIFFTIEEDELERQYASIPEADTKAAELAQQEFETASAF